MPSGWERGVREDMTDAQVCGGATDAGAVGGGVRWVGAGEVLVGRYEGAYDNGKMHGHGTYTWADGNRCARLGRAVPGVSRGGAQAQRAGAWRAGSMRQDMTDAQVCGGATDAGA